MLSLSTIKSVEYIVEFFDPTPDIYTDIDSDGNCFDCQIDGTEHRLFLSLPENIEPDWKLFLSTYRSFTGNPNWVINRAERWEPNFLEF